MTDAQMSSAVAFWLRQNGHKPATPSAAFFRPDGQLRDVRPAPEPNPKAVAAAQELDLAEFAGMRRAQLLQSMQTVRRSIGTFEQRGPEHPMLQPHDQFVKPLSDAIH